MVRDALLAVRKLSMMNMGERSAGQSRQARDDGVLRRG